MYYFWTLLMVIISTVCFGLWQKSILAAVSVFFILILIGDIAAKLHFMSSDGVEVQNSKAAEKITDELCQLRTEAENISSKVEEIASKVSLME